MNTTDFQHLLRQLMARLINHCTQHRFAAAVLLTQFGHSPGDLDFIMFVREQSTKEG